MFMAERSGPKPTSLPTSVALGKLLCYSLPIFSLVRGENMFLAGCIRTIKLIIGCKMENTWYLVTMMRQVLTLVILSWRRKTKAIWWNALD